MALMTNRSLKGAMTVEASIILPIVIICILPFIYLFRMLQFQIVLEKGIDECLKHMAIEMYILERVSMMPECKEEEETEIETSKIEQIEILMDQYTDFFEEEGWKDMLQEWGYELVGELLFQERLEEWLEAEQLDAWGVQDGWLGIIVSESDFLYTEDGHHDLIKGAVTFEWESMFSFWKPKSVTVQRVYHCFVGENGSSKVENEENTHNNIVVYRIGNGMKYHCSGCYLISKNVYTSTKSMAEKNGKQACGRCEPHNAITVYQTKGGEHYHMENCSYLNPDVAALSLEEAIRFGYTECGLCWEGNQYFS